MSSNQVKNKKKNLKQSKSIEKNSKISNLATSCRVSSTLGPKINVVFISIGKWAHDWVESGNIRIPARHSSPRRRHVSLSADGGPSPRQTCMPRRSCLRQGEPESYLQESSC